MIGFVGLILLTLDRLRFRIEFRTRSNTNNCAIAILIKRMLCFFFEFNLISFLSYLVRDWLCLVPPTAVVAGFGYMSYLAFCPNAQKQAEPKRVNNLIRMEDAKVADFVDIEDIAEKAAYCRCWTSKNVT